MTSRSHVYLLSLFCCRLIIIILNPNLSLSLSTLSYYNTLAHSYVNVENRGHEIVPEIISFSVNKIIGKERNNTVVKTCFLHDKSEEMIIKQWEELLYIKGKSTCQQILDLPCLNDISKYYTRIGHGFEL